MKGIKKFEISKKKSFISCVMLRLQSAMTRFLSPVFPVIEAIVG